VVGLKGGIIMQKSFEYILENNRLRALVREHMEVKPLRRATGVGSIAHALQIACGNGSSTSQIMRYFAPERLSAIDREGDLIAVARKTHDPAKFDFYARDVFSLGFDDNVFDAVFNLADLHNYEDWETGLMELKRVLKPGGLLIMEDLSRETFGHSAGKIFKMLTDHPYDSMLSMEDFRDFALRNGFEVLHFERRNPLGLLKYFIMIARKA
jgi:ubiquinone/menaquinone biosynthesis C-methylase UbiE